MRLFGYTNKEVIEMREDGYYWVVMIRSSSPEVALFIGDECGGAWFVTGDATRYQSNDIALVDERQIVQGGL